MRLGRTGLVLALPLAVALMAAGCSGDHHDGSNPNPYAGVYQGLIVQDNGDFTAVTAYIAADDTANLSLTQRIGIPGGAAIGVYRDKQYNGALKRADQSGVVIRFRDQQKGSPRLVAGKLKATDPALKGQIRLQRQEVSPSRSSLAGDYAFVDGAGKRWAVHIDAQNHLEATHDDCSFKGQLTGADNGVNKPAGLQLSPGQCSPFGQQHEATIFLQPGAVGSVDAVRVVFTDSDQSYDWYWFPV